METIAMVEKTRIKGILEHNWIKKWIDNKLSSSCRVISIRDKKEYYKFETKKTITNSKYYHRFQIINKDLGE